MSIFRIFWNMTSYMLRWGVLGGAALGALYGMAVALVIFLDLERGLNLSALPEILFSSVAFGAPFGALFGAIAGAVVGIFNGFSVGWLTWMVFSLSRNWGWYRLSIGIASAGAALAGGTMIFSMIVPSYNVDDFVMIAAIPSMIAAVVFAHASQRAAKRHLTSVTASQPYVRV